MERRRTIPELAERQRESQRRHYAKHGGAKQKARIQRIMRDEPFRWRSSLTTKWGKRISAADLEALWNKQRGRCALTGRPITIQEADLDHIVPLSRGGTSDISNLRWTWSRANEAKGNMTDEEFVGMCRAIVEEIGRAICSASGKPK